MRELPEGWVEVELGKVFGRKRGSALVPAKQPDQRFELYSVPAFRTGEPERPLGAEIGSSKQAVSHRTVLLCRINPRINRVWIVGPRTDDPQIASTEWIALRQVDGIAPRFLMYALRGPVVRRHLTSSVSGVGGSLMRVRMAAVWRTKVPVAPLSEQHRIVVKIDDLFARLDDGIAALKRAQANLERYRASVLTAAIEGRLTEQWRKRNPPEETGEALLKRILAERRKRWEVDQLAKFAAKDRKPPRHWKHKYKEPVQPTIPKLPELPEGWCWATVDQLAPAIQYGHTASADPSRQDGPRFLRITDIQRGRVQWPTVPGCVVSEREADRYRLSSGDIVFARTGATTGKSYLIENPPEAIFASYLIRVGLSGLVSSRYVSAFFQSGPYWEQIERGKRGIGQPNVNARVLADVTLPFPPFAEQLEIARRIVSTENALEQTSGRSVGNCLDTSTTLRQSILKQAFLGRLLPQDPDGEPASAILKRLHAASQPAARSIHRNTPSGRAPSDYPAARSSIRD